MANERTWQFTVNEATDNTSGTTNWKDMVWHIKAFLMGQLGGAKYKDIAAATLSSLAGFWTCYYSCDSSTAGSAGDGIDLWGTQGAGTANSGSAATITTGATIPGAQRLTGLTGMSAGSVGNMMTISGAATSANNSKTNTPWLIVQYNSASSVDVLNPAGTTTDANNGSIVWAERGAYTRTDANLVGNTPGSAHSWMVLKSPVAMGSGPWYIILDMRSSGTGNISLVVCKTAPTGGSTTVRPTSTDEVQATGWIDTNVYSSGQGRLHCGLTTLGDFYCIFSSDGNGIRSTMMLQALAEAKSSDAYPVWTYFAGGGNQPGSGNLRGNNYLGMKSATGVLSLLTTLYVPLWFIYGQNVDFFVNMSTTDATDAAYDDLPCYVYQSPAGYKSVRGRLVDLRWCPPGLSDGTVEPAAGTPASVAIGDLWFPICAAPTL